jgi:hypothetical protein
MRIAIARGLTAAFLLLLLVGPAVQADEARRREACLMRCRRGPPVQGVYEVRTRAEEPLRKVERPRLEYCLLREEYADRLLSLAQRSEEIAPDLSRRCVDRILKICPDASPEEGAFDGMVALVVQDCHFELRRLALLP